MVLATDTILYYSFSIIHTPVCGSLGQLARWLKDPNLTDNIVDPLKNEQISSH